jgi:hypothetical protein
MSDFVLKNAFVDINGTDFSNHTEEVHVTSEAEAVEDTAMGDGSRSYLQGFKASQISLVLQSDFDAGSVDAILWPIYDNGTAVPVRVRATTAAISATNPEWQLTGQIFNYNPLDGRVGELAKTPITFRSNGTALVRDTTP